MILPKLYLRPWYITRKIILKGSVCGLLQDPDPSDPKRPDLTTGSRLAKLQFTPIKYLGLAKVRQNTGLGLRIDALCA